MLPPLTLSAGDSRAFNGVCDSIKKAITNLKDFQKRDKDKNRTEKGLSKLVNKLELELKNRKCDNNNVKEDAMVLLQSTKLLYPQIIKVETGTRTTIVITRDSLSWTFVLHGNEVGKWVTTYGFGFSSAKYNGDSYVTKQLLDTSAYKIIKSTRPQIYDLNYIPAVFFSYFPTNNNEPCNYSCTAGLGYDLSAPVIFGGFNIMYRYNIGLSLGVVFQQQYRLKGQYNENDIISVPLDINQLHDKIYRPNIYLAVHFRFGENPFKTKQVNAEE